MIDQEKAWRLLQLRQEREVNRLRRDFQAKSLDLLSACLDPEGRLRPEGRLKFNRLMKPVYDEFYGAFQGDESGLFYQLTIRHSREARKLAGVIQRSIIADIVAGRIDLPFDRLGRERG